MIDLSFDFTKLFGGLDKITKAAEEGARPAAQEGAQVFYEEVEQRVSGIGGGPGVVTGKLKDAIYQAFVEKESGNGRAVYRISWNKKKAPHGHLLERGTSKMAARPFIRPSYDAKRSAAIQAVNVRLAAELKKVTQ